MSACSYSCLAPVLGVLVTQLVAPVRAESTRPVSQATSQTYPYNTAGRLAVWEEGSSEGFFEASGVAVGRRTVLTAAHVVQPHDAEASANPWRFGNPSTIEWHIAYYDPSERNMDGEVDLSVIGVPAKGKPFAPARTRGIPARYSLFPTDYATALAETTNDGKPKWSQLQAEIWNQDIALLGFLQNCVATPAPWVRGAVESRILEKDTDFFWRYQFSGGFSKFPTVEGTETFQKMMVGYPNAYIPGSPRADWLPKLKKGELLSLLPLAGHGRMFASNPAFSERFHVSSARAFWWDPDTDARGKPVTSFKGDVFGWIGHSGSPLFVRSVLTKRVPSNRQPYLPQWSVAGVYSFAGIKGFQSASQLFSLIFTLGGDAAKIQGAFRAIDRNVANAIDVMDQRTFDQAVPANDLVGRAKQVHAGERQPGGNVNATVEAGEPKHHDAFPASKSVWYHYRSNGLGAINISLERANFHGVLAVYEALRENGSVRRGNRRGSSGSPSISFDRSVTFTPVPGDSEFLIVVGGIGSSQGTFDLTCSQAPDRPPTVSLTPPALTSATTGQELIFSCFGDDPEDTIKTVTLLVDDIPVARAAADQPGSGNLILSAPFRTWSRRTLRFQAMAEDFFNQRAVSTPVKFITFTPPAGDTNVYESDAFAGSALLADPDGDGLIVTRGSSFGAGVEGGEPREVALATRNGGSVWWRWQAPANGYATISTENLAFSHQLEVFRGSTLPDLVLEASADGTRYTDQSASARVLARVRKNQIYHIRISDENGNRGDIELRIQFDASNMPPRTQEASHAVETGVATNMRLGGTDPDRDRLRWQVAAPPLHGTLAPLSGWLEEDSLPVYTPDAGYRGTDSFTFTVHDGELASDAATISLRVRDADAGGALFPESVWTTQSLAFTPARSPGFHEPKYVVAQKGYDVYLINQAPAPTASSGNLPVNLGSRGFGGGGWGIFNPPYFFQGGAVSAGRLNTLATSVDHQRWVVGGLFDRGNMENQFGPGDLGQGANSYGLLVFEEGYTDPVTGQYVLRHWVPTAPLPRPTVPAGAYPRDSEAVAVAFQPDGGIIVGGILGEANPSSGGWFRARGFLKRLVRNVAADSTVSYVWDPGFSAAVASPVLDLECGRDGSVFALLRDAPYLAKFKPDGSADADFIAPAVRPAGSVLPAMRFVEVGDPDDRVPYDFEIGAYEVTNNQYAAFLNAVAAEDPRGLYAAEMATEPQCGIVRGGLPGAYQYSVKEGRGNHPVVFVSQADAARFVNWMHNGAVPGGDTEHGTYELNGTDPEFLTRNRGATFFLPSAAEWDKAAYYQPGLNPGSGYRWLYPTRFDTQPVAEPPYGGLNSANFFETLFDLYAVNDLTEVGSYFLAGSACGTYDQAGNVSEYFENTEDDGVFSNTRGGAWNDSPGNMARGSSNFGDETNLGGFRVAASRGRNPVTGIALVSGGPNDPEFLVLGGNFQSIAGQPRRGVARLKDNGSLDGGFVPPAGLGGRLLCINALAALGDGSVLAGGDFMSAGGQHCGSVFRLRRDGSLHPAFTLDPMLSASVHSLALDPVTAELCIAGRMKPVTYQSGSTNYEPLILVHLGNKLPVMAWRDMPSEDEVAAGGTYTLGVDASDPEGAIRAVEYTVYATYNGGTSSEWRLQGRATDAPHRIAWTVPANAPAGSDIIIEAKVIDDLGAVNLDYLYYTVRDSAGVMPGEMMMPETLAFFTGVDAEGWSQMGIAEDQSMPLALVGSDGPGRMLLHSVQTAPSSGTLEGINGRWIYQPGFGFDGVDEVVIRSVNGLGDEVISRIRFVVQGTTDPPVAFGGTISTIAGHSVTFEPTIYDPDTGNAPLSLLITVPPTHGTASVAPGEQLHYTPAAGFSGEDSFSFVATEGTRSSVPATMRVIVFADASSASSPGQVQGLNASDGLMSAISLAWVPNADTTFHEIWRGSSPDLAGAVMVGVSLTPDHWVDRSADPDTAHYYWVRAGNDRGVGAFAVPDAGSRVSSDLDHDGMPDAWEIANGLSVGVDDSLLDADADGAANRAEFAADTAPNTSRDVFRLAQPEHRSEPARLHFGWSSRAGRNYRVESSPNLRDWQTLMVLPGKGAQVTADVPLPALNTNLFIRLSIIE